MRKIKLLLTITPAIVRVFCQYIYYLLQAIKKKSTKASTECFSLQFKDKTMNIASLNNNISYKEDKPSIQLLLETSFSKEIRIAFKAGQIMKEHMAPGPIVVEVFEGVIDFGVDGKVLHLKKGDLITLEALVPHDLKAIDDSIARLTLSKSDDVERVFSVIK